MKFDNNLHLLYSLITVRLVSRKNDRVTHIFGRYEQKQASKKAPLKYSLISKKKQLVP